MTPRLLSRPLALLVALALVAPAAASAGTPSPVAAPTTPAPVAATPKQTATPPATTRTVTPTTTRRASTYTPSSRVATIPVRPAGPTPAQRAAARRAKLKARQHALAAARKHREKLQLLAAAQAHSEAVLRAELTAAKRANAVEVLAGSVAGSIGAAPARPLHGAPTATVARSSGGGSPPLPALMLGACAALLGIGAAFAARRGPGLVTASLSLLVLLLAGI